VFLFNKVNSIQGVTEKSALILTGNRTHQKEQLFSAILAKNVAQWLKNVGKPFISPKLSYLKT
jgi:hypothetical protein